MDTNTNTNTTINPNTTTDTEDQFLTIIDVPSIAPEGPNTGTITDVVLEQSDAGSADNYKRLKLTVVLDAKDDFGQPFTIDTFYNVLGKGRGVNDFCGDCSIITKKKFGPQDLRKFNKGTLRGQRAAFNVKYRKAGKNQVPAIAEFLPFSNATVGRS